ncbi:MAG: glycosyltransferase family 39 protein [Candidatus Latescibacterota bacterium]|nr:MAG: glycosyltransferase family 39 protein [Candidatus Latescibacterota bacterium]
MNRGLAQLKSLIQDHKGTLLIAGVAVVVFLSRLPFVGTGFGRDPDAWRFVNAAHLIATTHEYHASRPPGYPVPEFVYSLLLLIGSPWLVVVAAVSAVGTALFMAIAKICGCRDSLFAGLALAGAPVVYINSTNAMDYIWALTFVLAALYCVLRKHTLAAGILLGIGVGCRITSIVMLIPLTIMLLDGRSSRGRNLRDTLTLWLAALITSGLLYTPVILKYGLGTFTFIDPGYEITVALELAGVGVWGTLGLGAIFLGICASVIISLARSRSRLNISDALRNRHVVTWLTTIVLYFALFFRLPGEAGYLLITVPFVVLVLARTLKRTVFIIICVLIAASSFVEINRTGIFPGPILQNRHVRKYHLMNAILAVQVADDLKSDKFVIVAGPMAPQLQALRYLEGVPDERKTVYFVDEIDLRELERHLESGFEVYICTARVPPQTAGCYRRIAEKRSQTAG